MRPNNCFWEPFLIKNQYKINPKANQQKRSPQNIEFDAKGCQNGAQTNQKSMPKLVTKKTIQIIKNHVSLNGKVIQIHRKTNLFEGLAGCVRERKKVSTKTSTMIPKSIPKSIKNNAEGIKHKLRNIQQSIPKSMKTLCKNYT